MISKEKGYFVTTVKVPIQAWKDFRIKCVQEGKTYQKGFEEALYLVAEIKKHYVGIPDHISDCSVCAFIHKILEGKK